MAPTTISIARVVELGVPIAWQEAVEVARAAEAAAERQARRLTLEGCIISAAGTVEVGSDGADRLGADLSALQLLAILLEGQQAPAELRALAATADDALSSFPSESASGGEQTLTLDWFVRPNPEIEIANLATRALHAAAPPVEPPPAAFKPRANRFGGDRSAPMTFEPRPAERRALPVEEPARPVLPPVPVRPAGPPVAVGRSAPAREVVPDHSAEPRPQPTADGARATPTAVPGRSAQPARPAAPEPREEPPTHAVPPRPADRRSPKIAASALPAPAVPVPEPLAQPAPPAAAPPAAPPLAEPAAPDAPPRLAGRPTAAVPERVPERPLAAAVERRVEPPASAVLERRAGARLAAAAPPATRPDALAARPDPALDERRLVRPEPAGAEPLREPHHPVTGVAQFRPESVPPPAAPLGTEPQVRPVVRAITHQFSAVIEQGRRMGPVPLVILSVVMVVAGGLAIWALVLPTLPARLTYRSLGPLTPFARSFEPNLPIEARMIAPRGMSPAAVGTIGTAGSARGPDALRLARVEPAAPPASQPAPAPKLSAGGSDRPAASAVFTAPSSASPTAVTPPAVPPAAPAPAGRVVASPLGAAPRDRRVYTANDTDVEPPTMRRPQLQMEPRADTAPSDSYVEVVVDERGEVTQVRLRSSDLSLNDRMIVAAAKAWQFEPAMKDGRPVKYVLRVPVTR